MNNGHKEADFVEEGTEHCEISLLFCFHTNETVNNAFVSFVSSLCVHSRWYFVFLSLFAQMKALRKENMDFAALMREASENRTRGAEAAIDVRKKVKSTWS